MTYVEAVARARQTLVDAGLRSETATMDADLLARHAAGFTREAWLIHRREVADPDVVTRFNAFIERRRRREPVAYIRGVQEFYGREFAVGPEVLIPRPETELLVDVASAQIRQEQLTSLVDVGSGSGCIAITLACEHPDLVVHAVDVSEPALDVARRNAARHDVAARIHFIHGSLLAGVPRPIDLIVANPPYVAERDRTGLSPEVGAHEPAVALYGGFDGWQLIRTLLREAAAALSAEGQLLMELGYGQSERIAEEVLTAGLTLANVYDDLQGITRVARIAR